MKQTFNNNGQYGDDCVFDFFVQCVVVETGKTGRTDRQETI